MLKRTLCILAVLLMLVGLTGCLTSGGGNVDETNPLAGASDGEAVATGQTEKTTLADEISEEPDQIITAPPETSAPPTEQNVPQPDNVTKTTTTQIKTTQAKNDANKPKQSASYKNSSFYKAIKSGKYYLAVDNHSVNKKDNTESSQKIVMAANGTKQYVKLAPATGDEFYAHYTTDGKNLNVMINASGLKFYVPNMPIDEKEKETFVDIAADWTDFGTYVKTTVDGDTIVEHYKLGKKSKRYIFKNNNNKPGAVIGMETDTGDVSAKATITSFEYTPSEDLFKKPKGYIDLSKLPSNFTMPSLNLPGLDLSKYLS